jgi:hypothetical protein
LRARNSKGEDEMKSLALCFIYVALSLSALSCAPQRASVAPVAPYMRKADVSRLVPADLSFAKDFVQTLSDAGWEIREVSNSKFNGFFPDTEKSAYIETDKGVIEAIFFQSKADVEQIQVSEVKDKSSGYHGYTVRKPPATNQRIEGGDCYFKKYRNVFVITSDREANDALNQLLV